MTLTGAKTSPPPLIGTQGDVFLVHATNGFGDPTLGTALHSHGMFFNGTNYYDGAVGITQCSIPSGRTMDYHIDTSLQASLPSHALCASGGAWVRYGG